MIFVYLRKKSYIELHCFCLKYLLIFDMVSELQLWNAVNSCVFCVLALGSVVWISWILVVLQKWHHFNLGSLVFAFIVRDIFFMFTLLEKIILLGSFTSKIVVKGKELWSHIDGSDPAPNVAEKLAKWEIEDARVWAGYESHLFLKLRSHKTAKKMRDYLVKRCTTKTIQHFSWSMNEGISLKRLSQLRITILVFNAYGLNTLTSL